MAMLAVLPHYRTEYESPQWCRMDVEAEMNRFEQALEVEKRQYLEQADIDAVREVTVAVDALSTCCLGVIFCFTTMWMQRRSRTCTSLLT